MQEGEVGEMLRQSILVALKLSGPSLMVALVVGLVMSLVQAVTQINEQSLSFLPKVAAIGATMLLLGSFMVQTLSDFTRLVFEHVVEVGGS